MAALLNKLDGLVSSLFGEQNLSRTLLLCSSLPVEAWVSRLEDSIGYQARSFPFDLILPGTHPVEGRIEGTSLVLNRSLWYAMPWLVRFKGVLQKQESHTVIEGTFRPLLVSRIIPRLWLL